MYLKIKKGTVISKLKGGNVFAKETPIEGVARFQVGHGGCKEGE
jgi:hypothetical protein